MKWGFEIGAEKRDRQPDAVNDADERLNDDLRATPQKKLKKEKTADEIISNFKRQMDEIGSISISMVIILGIIIGAIGFLTGNIMIKAVSGMWILISLVALFFGRRRGH